jgi:lipopolysaccharide export LptBFGC system permease protein LptF
MAHIFEALMVISFGISWPTSIIKSYTSRTAKGKSLIFLLFILIGYVFGIVSKFIAGNLTYVVVFYVINFVMVFVDLCLYYRNRRLDAAKETLEVSQ